MQIIPVVDVLNGMVVHAKQGQRSQYMPIQSLLTTSSEPIEVITALLNTYSFHQLYIADLNAIQKHARNSTRNYSVLEAIIHRFPQLNLWIDAGVCDEVSWRYWEHLKVNIVLGSENFHSIEDYQVLTENKYRDFVLSLDFMPDGYKGPPELITESKYWPNKVIVMSLNKVGSQSGIDESLIHTIRAKCTNHLLFAAGGVRHRNDLIQLKNMKIEGALIATALHKKTIDRYEILNFMQ